MNWYDEYRSEEWFARLRADFNRRHYDTLFDDPDDVFWTAIERLFTTKLPSAERKYTKKSAGLVVTIFRNTVVDLVREHFGRYQPPLAVRRRGQLYLTMYELYCLGRNSSRDISEAMMIPLTVVRGWIRAINTNKWCPKLKGGMIVSTGSNEHPGVEAIDSLAHVDDTEADQINAELCALAADLLEGHTDDADRDSRFSQIAEKLQQMPKINITDEERIMLKLIHEEEKSLTETADITNKPRHHVRNRNKALIKRLRQHFTEHDILD